MHWVARIASWPWPNVRCEAAERLSEESSSLAEPTALRIHPFSATNTWRPPRGGEAVPESGAESTSTVEDGATLTGSALPSLSDLQLDRDANLPTDLVSRPSIHRANIHGEQHRRRAAFRATRPVHARSRGDSPIAEWRGDHRQCGELAAPSVRRCHHSPPDHGSSRQRATVSRERSSAAIASRSGSSPRH